MRYWLVMPAAGAGRRFGGSTPKQYAVLHGRTVLEWALAPFLSDTRCSGVAVALSPDDHRWPQLAQKLPPVVVASGGTHRSESVRNALAVLGRRARPDDWVLVHDAARPCVTRAEIDRLIKATAGDAVGGLLALPVADTLKRVDDAGVVRETQDRSALWRALTPQMFRYARLCEALDLAHGRGMFPTDEAQAMEWLGESPKVVAGAPTNIKITSAEDLAIASASLADGPERGGRVKIGSGFDVHAFGPGDSVMLAGVRVPHSQGVVAHSDGDVVLHALCDAILGAAGLGDIGQHFRDDDPKWRGADSSLFVKSALEMARERGLRVGNADITLLAEKPKVAPHREAMRIKLAELLEVPEQQVNLKATTTERLGFLGRGEGIAAQAVVLLVEA